jgi:prepilin-type N-terminal cleavage/methylation domain-containing protein
MNVDIQTQKVIQTDEHKSKKRGFTLTEIAIVLGIIGLILGAIWVAAAAVYNNQRVTTTQRDLLAMAQAVTTLYANASAVDPTSNFAGFTPATNENTNPYVLAGVVPTDMLSAVTAAKKGVPANQTVTNVWGGAVYIGAAGVNGGTNNAFQIAFDAVPENACISLATTMSSSTSSGTLSSIDLAANGTLPTPGATWASDVFPLSPSTVAPVCTTNAATGSASISFTFLLKG